MSDNRDRTPLFSNEEEALKSLNDLNGFSNFREEAFKLWKETSPPTSRDEYWKYTRVAPLLKKTYHFNEAKVSDNISIPELENSLNLVFVNGQVVKELSTSRFDDDFIFCDLKTAKEKHADLLKDKLSNLGDSKDYFSLLNNAFHQNGPFIYAGKNKQIDEVLNIVHLSGEEDRLINLKGLVIAEVGSKVLMAESYLENGGLKNLINTRNNYFLNDNASVELIKFQDIGAQNNLVNQDFVNQSRDSRFTSHTISISGNMIRNNVNSDLNGEGANCELNGLYTLKGEEHVDNHTQVTHAVPHCESHELYKGVLNEKSKGVFNGKVIVSRDAQKTNAFQYNGNILLSDNAEIYSKPELEIYADDVKCSHGSTTGQLDEEAMFYLQARGISKEGARNLLLQAFASEVVDKIPVQGIKEQIEKHLINRYHTLGNA